MAKPTDETGNRYGRLLVLKRADKRSCVYWLCRCDCGKEHTALGSNLRGGRAQSCGCSRTIELDAEPVDVLTDCETCDKQDECRKALSERHPLPCKAATSGKDE